MAKTRSAAKRARQTRTRALRNQSVKTQLRRLQKRIRSESTSNREQILSVISAIDKAAKRGIIHRNAANRRKARLNKTLAAGK